MQCQANVRRSLAAVGAEAYDHGMKGADKQKKLAKKAPQKTLKEKRAEKRAKTS